MSNNLPDAFQDIRHQAQLRLLKLYYEANSGHVGGSLSCLDALLVLHHAVLSPADRFILSKGHAAGALYTTLWSTGKLTAETLATFCTDDTTIPSHPSGSGVPDLLFPTGSLGHGPSLSAGLAIAMKYKKEKGKVYCLCSDGEWQEGACWEALAFAVKQQLDNLVILIDQNGLQGFGTTNEVMGVSDLTERIKEFGAVVQSIDGHDPQAILSSLTQLACNKPNVILLSTRKGLGLHYENRLESHYLPLTKEQYEQGILRLQKGNF